MRKAPKNLTFGASFGVFENRASALCFDRFPRPPRSSSCRCDDKKRRKKGKGGRSSVTECPCCRSFDCSESCRHSRQGTRRCEDYMRQQALESFMIRSDTVHSNECSMLDEVAFALQSQESLSLACLAFSPRMSAAHILNDASSQILTPSSS